MEKHQNFRGLDRSVRKQKIIDTAAALFHKKGYTSTSLDDVAGALGITKAALYHYVGSKDELLSIIYTQAFENVFRDTCEISAMDLPPDKKLRRIIRNHIKNIIIKDLAMFSVYFSEESQLPEKDFMKIREEKKKYTGMIREILEEGKDRGLFKPADSRLQAYAILGMCNWIYKWYRTDRSLYKPGQIADHFIALLEGGYLAGRDTENDGQGNGSADMHRGALRSREDIHRRIKEHLQAVSELVEVLNRRDQQGISEP